MPVIGPKMQENTSKLKNVELQNKSSHVILRNLYAASFLVWPACAQGLTLLATACLRTQGQERRK